MANDDISSLIAFGGNKIGVFWSNQTTYVLLRLAPGRGCRHRLGIILGVFPGSGNGDDHMNLKSLHTDGSGRVFAVVKTSLTGGNEPIDRPPGAQCGGVLARSHDLDALGDAHAADVMLDTRARAHPRVRVR